MEFILRYGSSDIFDGIDKAKINACLQDIVSNAEIDPYLHNYKFYIAISLLNFVVKDNDLKRITVAKKWTLYSGEIWNGIDILVPANEEKNIASKQYEKHKEFYEIDYKAYDSLTEYIEDAIIIGLNNLFKNGVQKRGSKLCM
jgi:hypothetical protein